MGAFFLVGILPCQDFGCVEILACRDFWDVEVFAVSGFSSSLFWLVGISAAEIMTQTRDVYHIRLHIELIVLNI